MFDEMNVMKGRNVKGLFPKILQIEKTLYQLGTDRLLSKKKGTG
jgi:hypothetical protein